ncbi:MAG: hypothetical protein GXO25_02415 [Euryarchaeota archaeon]|nr:hypothetical protein [Euryarchaeota archaeon]
MDLRHTRTVGMVMGILILAINSILWLYLLAEIKRMPLPVNCDGAWPDNLPLIVFISFLLTVPLLYVRGKIDKMESPVMTVLLLLDFTVLGLFILNTGVMALCECSKPSIITRSYQIAAFFYIFDSAVKSYILFGKEGIKEGIKKKE